MMAMDREDEASIERYARAHYTNPRIDQMRNDAIVAHRRYLRETKQRDWNLHMKFMSEVDTPVPDYSLRAMYRKQLLGAGS